MTNLLFSQWFDKTSLRSTVLLEKQEGSSLVPLGTGFVMWNYANPDYPIVVTAGHLLKRSEIYVSVNADSQLITMAKKKNISSIKCTKLMWNLIDHKLTSKVSLITGSKQTFIIDDSTDVGIFLIDLYTSGQFTKDDTTKIAELTLIPRSQIRFRRDVSLGDELFFVGFPFGIGTSGYIEPIVRSGSVAWLSASSHEFLLDAFSFGGNSGSPIFSKIVLGRKPGELNWDNPYFVGMIVGHIGENVQGLLTQPNPNTAKIDRIDIETQNYGLARCVWSDEILRVIKNVNNLQLPQ